MVVVLPTPPFWLATASTRGRLRTFFGVLRSPAADSSPTDAGIRLRVRLDAGTGVGVGASSDVTCGGSTTGLSSRSSASWSHGIVAPSTVDGVAAAGAEV